MERIQKREIVSRMCFRDEDFDLKILEQLMTEERKNKATHVNISALDFDNEVTLSFYYNRLETDQEFDMRKSMHNKAIKDSERRELAQLAALKAKYEK